MIGAQPVLILKSANDGRLFRVSPGTVDLTITGEVFRLRRLSPRDIQAYVNLADDTRGGGVGEIRVTLPRGMKVEKIFPRQAQIEMVSP